jgi:hypothetical protein
MLFTATALKMFMGNLSSDFERHAAVRP